jgi:DNA modification methylase
MRRDEPRGPELTWPGKHEARVQHRTHAPKLSTIETIDRGGAASAGGASASGHRNRLIRADNRAAMRALLPELGGSIDLVYLDPPFGTGGSFALTERASGEGEEVPAYSDRWSVGLGDYLSTMLDQLELMRALLSDRGTIFLHCDWRVSHHLRCLLDEVFGPACFKNEIVWRYRRWPAKTRVFQRMHDVIFWYGKRPGDAHAWTPHYEPLAPSTRETWGTKRQIADFSSGRRKPSQTEEESLGAPMSDVWDIGIIAPIAKERVGYPTQKPEALLRRVIESASRPGDLVADFFAGSGTTLAVAEKLGRRWIGGDAGRTAIHTARKRLAAIDSAAFDLLAPEDEPAGEGVPPSVRVSVTRAASARSVEVRLEGEGADAVDYWAIDWEHDGRVFQHTWRAGRQNAKTRVPLAAEHTYAASGKRRIAVLVAGAGGQERREVIAWEAT